MPSWRRPGSPGGRAARTTHVRSATSNRPSGSSWWCIPYAKDSVQIIPRVTVAHTEMGRFAAAMLDREAGGIGKSGFVHGATLDQIAANPRMLLFATADEL